MAVVADLGLRRRLHYGVTWRMADVAIGAGDFVIIMWPAVPAEADIRVVATKAHVILDADLGFLMRAKLDYWRTYLAAPYPRRVCPTWAVAGLALQLSVPERAARIGGYCVFATKYC